MSKKTQKIIELTDDVAIKIEDNQYIIAYKYTNAKTKAVSWVSDCYHPRLDTLFASLPDYIIRRKDITSLKELYSELQNVVEMLKDKFNILKKFDKRSYELHLVKKDK